MKNVKKILLGMFPILFAAFAIVGCEEDLAIVPEDSFIVPEDSTVTVTDNSAATENKKAGLVIEKANYYVSPTGNDGNPGTIDKPFKSWDKIIDVVKAGDLVYLRGGTYYHSARCKGNGCYLKGKSGSTGKYIRLWAYPGETPVLDGSKMTPVSGQGVLLAGNYWHIKGIEVKNFKQSVNTSTNVSTVMRGMTLKDANYNIIENVKIHDNQGIGLGMGGSSTKNLIKNSDFYNNYDKYTINTAGAVYRGGNADGVHLRAVKGTSNTMTGCRFYNNSDDGMDLWENEGVMIVDSCWSFKNGIDMGDGNGFKLGRTLQTKETYIQRRLSHCISYANKGAGYDQNDANVQMSFYNNVAYANKGKGFYLAKYNLKNYIRNNISLSNGQKDVFTAESVITNNSWNITASISTSDFTSVNSEQLLYPRKANGSLPDITFLVPTSTSLIDKGKDVGYAYKGAAPDIGVFEVK